MTGFSLPDVPGFMSKLLIGSVFDSFLLVEAQISGRADVTIDGRLNEEFYDTEELAERKKLGPFVSYGELKALCFEAIRGKNTPVSFRFILRANDRETAEVLAPAAGEAENISGLFINITYRQGSLTATTGISNTGFMKKGQAAALWDDHVRKIFREAGTGAEEMK